MGKWLKTIIFAALLIAAGYLFGYVCKQAQQGYELLFSPSAKVANSLPVLRLSSLGSQGERVRKDAIRLALWLLAALGAMALTAGLVAALVRSLWVCLAAFALSALAMPFAWGLKATSGVLASVYFIASALYARGVAKGLEERFSFSVRPISESQSTLIMALIIVACGSLYLGYAAHIEEEGFSIPPPLTDAIMERVEREIEKRVPEAGREEVLGEFKEGFEKGLEEFVEKTIRPYEKFIPLAIALSLFMPLVTSSLAPFYLTEYL